MNTIYNEETKIITIHFVSDSTGETIDNAVSATISQFPDLKKKEFFWPMVRSKDQVEEILENTEKNPGLIVFQF